MVPRLQEIDAVVADQIDDAVLLGQAAGPDAGGKVFQRFRLADSGKGVAQNRCHFSLTRSSPIYPVDPLFPDLKPDCRCLIFPIGTRMSYSSCREVLPPWP